MAKARLISKSLSTSRRFAALRTETKLHEFAQLLYCLLLPHTDDFGRMAGDAWTVKHTVMPASRRGDAAFESALVALEKVGLIRRAEVDNTRVLAVERFEQHQSGLHKRTSSLFPDLPQATPAEEPISATPPAWKPAPHAIQQLVNGASNRRHGQHAACPGRGLCVTPWVHEELLGKLGAPEREPELREWYARTVAALNGQPVGDAPDAFWRNKFAEWVPPTTSAPANTAGARRSQQLRKSLAAFAAAHPTGRPI